MQQSQDRKVQAEQIQIYALKVGFLLPLVKFCRAICHGTKSFRTQESGYCSWHWLLSSSVIFHGESFFFYFKEWSLRVDHRSLSLLLNFIPFQTGVRVAVHICGAGFSLAIYELTAHYCVWGMTFEFISHIPFVILGIIYLAFGISTKFCFFCYSL